jgi:DNA-binding MarR family transcriptional regulator
MLATLLKPLGLTPAWAEALIVLADREPLTIRQLGDLLVCQVDHPSRLVNRMMSAGLLTSEPSPDDDRVSCLRLSAGARELIPQIRTIEDQLHTTIEQAFDPSDLADCIAVLSGFVDGLPAGEALRRRTTPPQTTS